jgi:hypothetical protein
MSDIASRLASLEAQMNASTGPTTADLNRLRSAVTDEVSALKLTVASLEKTLAAAIAEMRNAAAKQVPTATLLEGVADAVAENINTLSLRTKRDIDDVRAGVGDAALSAKNAARVSAEISDGAIRNFANSFAYGA